MAIEVYYNSHGCKAVINTATEKSPGDGWTLADRYGTDALPASQEETEKAEIRAQLDAKGIVWDGRWGIGRLVAALEGAKEVPEILDVPE